MGQWAMQGLSRVSHTGVGWDIQKNILKNDSPQNQDLTTPKSSLEGVQKPSFEYENNYYYNFIF